MKSVEADALRAHPCCLVGLFFGAFCYVFHTDACHSTLLSTTFLCSQAPIFTTDHGELDNMMLLLPLNVARVARPAAMLHCSEVGATSERWRVCSFANWYT